MFSTHSLSAFVATSRGFSILMHFLAYVAPLAIRLWSFSMVIVSVGSLAGRALWSGVTISFPKFWRKISACKKLSKHVQVAVHEIRWRRWWQLNSLCLWKKQEASSRSSLCRIGVTKLIDRVNCTFSTVVKQNDIGFMRSLIYFPVMMHRWQ